MTPTTHHRVFFAAAYSTLLFFTTTFVSAFTPSSVPSVASTAGISSISSNSVRSGRSAVFYLKRPSPLEDEPSKQTDSYWDMLQAASKDPETFEKFIEKSMKKKKISSASSSSYSSVVDYSSSSKTTAASSTSEEEGENKPKKKYVPIEEWDANRSKPENMSKEERLQWECQRGGNQFRQNDILLHHLKSF